MTDNLFLRKNIQSGLYLILNANNYYWNMGEKRADKLIWYILEPFNQRSIVNVILIIPYTFYFVSFTVCISLDTEEFCWFLKSIRLYLSIKTRDK